MSTALEETSAASVFRRYKIFRCPATGRFGSSRTTLSAFSCSISRRYAYSRSISPLNSASSWRRALRVSSTIGSSTPSTFHQFLRSIDSTSSHIAVIVSRRRRVAEGNAPEDGRTTPFLLTRVGGGYQPTRVRESGSARSVNDACFSSVVVVMRSEMNAVTLPQLSS